MSVVHIHFEPDRAEADRQSLARLLAADATYDRGDAAEAEEHITFENIEGLLALMTPKRSVSPTRNAGRRRTGS